MGFGDVWNRTKLPERQGQNKLACTDIARLCDCTIACAIACSLPCFVSKFASAPEHPEEASAPLAGQYANCGLSIQWKYCDFTIPVNGMWCCSNLEIGLKSLFAETRRPARASGPAQSYACGISAGLIDPASSVVCPASRATPCRGSLHRDSGPTARWVRSPPAYRSRRWDSAPSTAVFLVLQLIVDINLGCRIKSKQ